MDSKICFKCNTEKPLPEYYKHSMMADGHLNKCKECTKSDVKKRESILLCNNDWVESEKERQRDKYYRLGYKEKHKQTPEEKKVTMDLYRNRYPEKKVAYSLCTSLKPSVKGNHLHHWSYNAEHAKDVIELEPKDHYLLHRHIKYDQNTKMYISKHGELLNTKQKHLEYLQMVIYQTFKATA